MPIFGPFPRADLPKNNLTSLLIRVTLDLDIERIEADLNGYLPAFLWARSTFYSRRKQKHRLFEAITHESTYPSTYSYVAAYSLTENNSDRIGPMEPRVKVQDYLNGISDVSADGSFVFDQDTPLGRRFARTFPFFADASELYPLPPKDPPLTSIWEIRGTKVDPENGFEYFLAVENTSGPFEVQVGILLAQEISPNRWIDEALERTVSIVGQLGG